MRMKLHLFAIIIIFCGGIKNSAAQMIAKYDTVFNFDSYYSFYSFRHQTSSFVAYKLYKPQQRVSRSGIIFKDFAGLPHFDYVGSGFDRGHLVPAADRSETKKRLQSTFLFPNVLPQTPALNRGSWKKYEGKTRTLAKSDSLLIVCGGCDYPDSTALIPSRCFKLVISLTTDKPILQMIFDNDNNARTSVCDSLIFIVPLSYIRLLF